MELCWSIDTNPRREATAPLHQRPLPDLTSTLQGSLTPAIRGVAPTLPRVRIEGPWNPHEAGSRRRLQRTRVAVCGCGRTARRDQDRWPNLSCKDPMLPERSTTIGRRNGAAGRLSVLPCRGGINHSPGCSVRLQRSDSTWPFRIVVVGMLPEMYPATAATETASPRFSTI